MKIETYDVVRLTGAKVPVRYQNRTGVVIGTVTKGRGRAFEIDLTPRRATPLVLAANQLTVL